MSDLVDILLLRTWWTYDPAADWYAQPYHWLNLAEGATWLVFALLVLRRCLARQGASIEAVYALAFLTFAATDFVEAYVVTTPLILFKGANLVALLWLRHVVIRLFYPGGRTY